MIANAAAVRRGGFTLIEVLAALAVTATVILAMTLAVGIVAGAWGRGWRSAETDDMIGRAASRFHDDVASLVPWRYVDDDQAKIAFNGERGSVVFAGVVRTGAYGAPRFRLVRYQIVPDAGGFGVERSTSLMPQDARHLSGIWSDTVKVLANVGRAQFGFADSTPPKTAWPDGWTAGPTLPTVVRLSLVVDGRVVVIDAPVYADPERDCLLPNPDATCPKQTGAGGAQTPASADQPKAVGQ